MKNVVSSLINKKLFKNYTQEFKLVNRTKSSYTLELDLWEIVVDMHVSSQWTVSNSKQ